MCIAAECNVSGTFTLLHSVLHAGIGTVIACLGHSRRPLFLLHHHRREVIYQLVLPHRSRGIEFAVKRAFRQLWGRQSAIPLVVGRRLQLLHLSDQSPSFDQYFHVTWEASGRAPEWGNAVAKFMPVPRFFEKQSEHAAK